MKKNWNKQEFKDLTQDIGCDIVGSILYSLGIYTFAKMGDFAPGGLSGLALIINHLWNLPIGIMTLVLNIPFIILSFRHNLKIYPSNYYFLSLLIKIVTS